MKMRREGLSIFFYLCVIISSKAQDITQFYQHNIQENSIHAFFKTSAFGNAIVYWGTDKTNLNNTVVYQTDDVNHEIGITGLDPATPYYIKFASRNTLDISDTAYSEVLVMMTKSQSSGDIKVYFNSPVDHSVSTSQANNAVYLNNAVDDTIIAYLDRAQESIDITIYNIDNDNGLIDAINDAYNRGVNVRIVGDEGISSTRWNALNVGGNKIKSPAGTGLDYALMHNKFIIIDAESSNPDQPVLITGSTNFTSDQILEDPNNLIIFQDQSLAKGYKIEFEEMFNGIFGPDKIEPTPRWFEVGDSPVELFFSPKSGLEDHLIENIQQTAYDFHFGVFAYTRWSVSLAIQDVLNSTSRFASGILKQVDTNESEYTILDGVMSSTLFVDNQPGLFHHKYVLLDPNCPLAEPRIWTGSANWSNNGFNVSDENVVVVHDHAIANQYYQEYIQRYKDNGGSIFVQGDCDANVLNLDEKGVDTPIDFKIYPNPSKGTFTLYNGHKSDVEIEVYDITGRKVRDFPRLSPMSLRELNIENGKGSYSIVITDSVNGLRIIKRALVH